MGATFVELDLEALEGTGGYAREMSEDRAARQRELLAPYVAKSDVADHHRGGARAGRLRCW